VVVAVADKLVAVAHMVRPLLSEWEEAQTYFENDEQREIVEL
jgi:hypothetical protein